MMPDQKFVELLHRLLQRSRGGEVNWQEGDVSGNFSEYLLVLPGYRLVILHEASRVNDTISISIDDAKDNATLYSKLFEEGGEGWELASALYSEALRKVRNWDEALEKIQQAIDAPGPVGLPAERAQVR